MSASQAVVRNLAAAKEGSRGEACVSISSAHNYELEDVKVLGPLAPPSIGRSVECASAASFFVLSSFFVLRLTEHCALVLPYP